MSFLCDCENRWIVCSSNLDSAYQYYTYARVWWRKGAKTESATGSGWKCIAGSLTKVAAGPAGVWGLDARNQVVFRWACIEYFKFVCV